jgi:hypothetical protein
MFCADSRFSDGRPQALHGKDIQPLSEHLRRHRDTLPGRYRVRPSRKREGNLAFKTPP